MPTTEVIIRMMRAAVIKKPNLDPTDLLGAEVDHLSDCSGETVREALKWVEAGEAFSHLEKVEVLAGLIPLVLDDQTMERLVAAQGYLKLDEASRSQAVERYLSECSNDGRGDYLAHLDQVCTTLAVPEVPRDNRYFLAAVLARARYLNRYAHPAAAIDAYLASHGYTRKGFESMIGVKIAGK